MRILYIIGNGLDIAHHMKTSYQDFFKYYLGRHSFDEDIRTMKDDIKNHQYETWADLEIGMGKYSSQCADKNVFLKCLADIKSNLKEYLQKESEKIKLYSLKSNSTFLDIGSVLDPQPQNQYKLFSNNLSRGKEISIMTFNYTSTLEWLLDFHGVPRPLSPTVSLYTIHHVHGTLDDMMVMGVNDSTQISNSNFSSDLDVVEEFVKPEYNDACMNNKNSISETLISNADIIVLYGTSLGQSDEKWWKQIGQRMTQTDYPLLVYLPFDEKKNQAAEPNHLRRWVMQSVREIKEKFDIQLEEKILATRICVAINKKLFVITKSPQQLV